MMDFSAKQDLCATPPIVYPEVMLRVVVVALLLANLLALSAWKGWLGEGGARGEPERLAAQLHPERIRLVRESDLPAAPAPAQAVDAAKPAAVEAAKPPPATAVPAVSAKPAAEASRPQQNSAPTAARPAGVATCVAYSEVSAEQLRLLTERVGKEGAAIRLASSPVQAPASWWVHIPPLGSREAAERRVAELRKLGVSDLFIVPDAGPAQFAISLGLFKVENVARKQLAALKARGVQDVQVHARGGNTYRVELNGPADRLASLAAGSGEALRGAARQTCKR
ncbi:MAG: SPOR domain-containing protein [Zoogloea sp.]|nr:SPOR domain-containing protein [Zoogloea sp.]